MIFKYSTQFYSGNQYKANGHCDNSIRMSLVVSQQGNSKSDRLEHSFSVYPGFFSQENVNLLSILWPRRARCNKRLVYEFNK